MSTQNFLTALKEGRAADAVSSINETLSEKARGVLSASRIQVAENYKMKMKESDEDDEKNDDDEEDEKEDM